MSQPSTAAPVAKHATLGLALVAVLAAVQGSDPNIASVALAEAVRGLDITNRSLAASIYRTLLHEIAREPQLVLTRRVSLTPLRKLWLAWKVQALGRL